MNRPLYDKWIVTLNLTCSKGEYIIEPTMDEIEILSTGLIKVKMDNKYKIASHDGTILFEVVADEMTALSYGVFAVKVDGVWGFMNKAGSWLIQPMFKEVILSTPNYPLVKIDDINAVKDIFYEATYSERNLPQKWYELWITNDGVFYSYQGKIKLNQNSTHSFKY